MIFRVQRRADYPVI